VKVKHSAPVKAIRVILLILALSVLSPLINNAACQPGETLLKYTVSMPDPSSHVFHIELDCTGWIDDTIDFRMPAWSPGYYQIMDFAKNVRDFSAADNAGRSLKVTHPDPDTWQVIQKKRSPFRLVYEVKAGRKFVGTSYLDSTRGYIIPAASFLYINGHINTPVSVRIILNDDRDKIATGLEPAEGSTDQFTAPDFDILYDCPILTGKLEELPSFTVNGIEHRFICYEPGRFNRNEFMENLKKVVVAATEIMGDIPYKNYTFIGIGPGRGGIEHLNNTTVSFDGNGLDNKPAMEKIMNFLAHEYFHNYNVKRIRPFELGPFDYNREDRTNLLWMSEGLTVYYEYLIVKKAGLINEQTLLEDLAGSINATERDPGRNYQSLEQASYNTWSDGPFGRQGNEADRSISYYEKGPVVGLILDLSILNATRGKRSLDDVMRLLYSQYYKKLGRGFTDAEFQEACESVAGVSLAPEFEYISTTKEIDYPKYLSFAGLKADIETGKENGIRKISISVSENMNLQQKNILQKWLVR
jgi:predicted metalloprotease with PDZ domain